MTAGTTNPIASTSESVLEFIKGLPYSYDRCNGGINCFDLVNVVRWRFGEKPIEGFDWCLDDYPSEKDLPADFILELLQKHAVPCPSTAGHLNLLALRFRGVIALGTCVVVDGYRYAAFMSPGGSRVVEFDRISGFLESVWVWQG